MQLATLLIAALLLPAAWGAFVAWSVGRLSLRRSAPTASNGGHPPGLLTDYQI